MDKPKKNRRGTMHRTPTTTRHRRSIRLKGYDYSQAGLYFITICTYEKTCLFGNIQKEEIVLNKFGIIARDEWRRTQQIRSNIELGEFIIMPNHIHGIIQINDRRGTMHRAPTMERFGKPTSNTIPTIIRGYKSTVTKQINQLRRKGTMHRATTVWQRNYYEHIIRNEQSYWKITEYITNNPLNWNQDRYYE